MSSAFLEPSTSRNQEAEQEFFSKIYESKSRHELELGLHISLKFSYVFVQVSKAASSTIKYYLQTKEFEGTRFSVQDVNNNYLSPLLSPFQLRDDQLYQILQSNQIRRVTFVRNPFSRLLSCYLDRIVARPHSASAKHYSKVFNTSKQPSFPEFIENICSQKSKDMERHWRVQSDETHFDVLRYDFIGKVEFLRRDMASLGALLYQESPQGDIVDKSPTVTNAREKLRSYYDNRTAKLVLDRYAKDFENFGYCDSLDKA